MANFTIVQQHSLSMVGARAAAQKVADQMEVDYEMTHQWVGDVLEFKRSGFPVRSRWPRAVPSLTLCLVSCCGVLRRRLKSR